MCIIYILIYTYIYIYMCVYICVYNHVYFLTYTVIHSHLYSIYLIRLDVSIPFYVSFIYLSASLPNYVLIYLTSYQPIYLLLDIHICIHIHIYIYVYMKPQSVCWSCKQIKSTYFWRGEAGSMGPKLNPASGIP